MCIRDRYASVCIIEDPSRGGSTDGRGNFRINNVPVGRYNIQASFMAVSYTHLDVYKRQVRIRPVKNAYFSSMSCNFANKKVQNNEQLII